MLKYSTAIGRKLLSYILAFSFVTTLAAFLYILLADYQRGISSYDKGLQQIRNSYQQSVSYSLWNFDSGQIEAQLLGILNFPGVVYVYIENNGEMLHSAGNIYARSDRRFQFDLAYDSAGRNYELGTLHLSLNYTGLYDEIRDKAINILLTQFIKTFSVSVFLLFIVHQLVTRRLARMADWAGNFSLRNLSTPLTIQDSSDRHDELTTVADAINQMRETLQQDISDQETSRRELENLKEKLSIAINNAAIGFCTYHSDEDTIHCNSHFASCLSTTEYELEAMQHPMEYLTGRITGAQAVQQKERLNQLLQGRLGRVHDTLWLKNFAGEERYLEMTFQITRYRDTRPQEILICIVDRTQEQNALSQARELTMALENKVTQRTEELYNEQLRSRATIEYLEQELQRVHSERSQEQQRGINELLLSQLQRMNQLVSVSQAPALPVFLEYLKISVRDEPGTINLTRCVQDWLAEDPALAAHINASLPFSLIIEEDPAVIRFLFRNLILRDPAMNADSECELTLRLNQDQVEFTASYQPADNQLPALNADEEDVFRLCEYIISLRLHGSLSRTSSPGGRILVRFTLSMTHP
ncbi:MAG: hypothetical protein KYX62_16685 [Pseudomonadota bacterium]|nr:hypothetical protein [Pseudomonadota bacterium]